MLLLWLYPQTKTHQLPILTYSMKRVALACSQGLALLGFFPCTIIFFQSQINDPDPQMFLFYGKKILYGSFFIDGVQLPQGQNEKHFGEAVYFLPLSSQKLLVLIFYQPLKDKQHKILKSDPKKGVSVLAKMLFPQVDEGFWLCYASV